MTSDNLRKKCIERFGQEKGSRLFNLMDKVRRIDFCVATGWDEMQISIARGCTYRGQTFLVSGDYKNIIASDGSVIKVETASYGDISRYLPHNPLVEFKKRERHCFVDD